MASNIDITKPSTGAATTQSVRDNFQAAKEEIEALQDNPVIGDSLTITDTDPGAAEGPLVTVRRDSISPGDDDLIGALLFSGNNDAAQPIVYAKILTQIKDASDGTEDGYIAISTMQAGTLTPVIEIDGQTITIDGTVSFDSITLDDLTVTTAATFAGATIADLGIVTTADINGGTIDGTTVGQTTPGLGTFTTLNSATLQIGGVAITSTPAELNTLDGYLGDVTDFNYLTTLFDTGITDIDFSALDGITSNIQTQINAKPNAASPTFTGTVNVAALVASGSITAANFIGNGSGITNLPPQAPVLNEVSSATTAVVGQAYVCDTSAGAFPLTLPATPTSGALVSFTDYAGTFKTNNLTLGRNGENIVGLAEDLIIDLNYASLRMLYIDGTQGWIFL